MLFAILMIAVGGLIWATAAAARHIKHSRRRRRDRRAERQNRMAAKRIMVPASGDAQAKRVTRQLMQSF